jgi:hypothetical protein
MKKILCILVVLMMVMPATLATDNRVPLGVSMDTLISRMSANHSKLGMTGKIQYVTDGLYMYGDYVIYGFSGDSKSMDAVYMLGTGDGSLTSGLEIIQAATAFVVAVDDTLSLDKSGDVIMELVEGSGVVIRGNIVFVCVKDDSVGTMFTATKHK